MITLNEQNQLFTLIASKLKFDITCYAFGGTAMMYYGYKDSTKDIDLVFTDEKERDEFVRVLRLLGYKNKSINDIYSKNNPKHPPLLLERDTERFDIFLKSVFHTKIIDEIKDDFYAKYDFVEKKTLTIITMKKEDIILLKSVTDRIKDFDDILTICQKDNLNWDYITDTALLLKKAGNQWIVIDLEEKMQKLKQHIRLEKKYFDKLY